jgi:hypothetical protein
MENFGGIDSFPQSMTEAKKKYDDCKKWNVTMAYPRYDGKLTQAFKENVNQKSYLLRLIWDIISLMPTCRCILQIIMTDN